MDRWNVHDAMYTYTCVDFLLNWRENRPLDRLKVEVCLMLNSELKELFNFPIYFCNLLCSRWSIGHFRGVAYFSILRFHLHKVFVMESSSFYPNVKVVCLYFIKVIIFEYFQFLFSLHLPRCIFFFSITLALCLCWLHVAYSLTRTRPIFLAVLYYYYFLRYWLHNNRLPFVWPPSDGTA